MDTTTTTPATDPGSDRLATLEAAQDFVRATGLAEFATLTTKRDQKTGVIFSRWLWLEFPTKPTDLLRAELKRRGFTWCGKRGRWYRGYSLRRGAWVCCTDARPRVRAGSVDPFQLHETTTLEDAAQ